MESAGAMPAMVGRSCEDGRIGSLRLGNGITFLAGRVHGTLEKPGARKAETKKKGH